ncbi:MULTISPECIES: cupredoxin domain-containing protein [unclassified Paenibacillus]|uniref:cupredoxin domain-containing protein n=1 Tax=unclassified Paenibacillus TaxID=185978 RepID=UPI001C10F2A3|nr:MULTISPECIES: cupredoxin domain-containing protein [unclassified Paenibacillus]MBU5443084.1 cupredoxin domain-containing protein [Paenibacillus sp. MSJ-34]CAH0122256.1 hypothetical protein PAE9249_04804 [Paenibacillus sp. CECT 9249]
MSLILVSALFGALTVWTIGFIVFFRKNINGMVGMTAAMAAGMTIGLAMGALLALWLPGQFFHSTMVGMIIGGAAGAAAGIPVGFLALIEGLLSGIMGGMMGTMLMVMVPAPYAETTVNIMSVLCSGILFLLFVTLHGEVNSDKRGQKSFVLAKPVSMFSVILIALLSIQASSLYDDPEDARPSPPGQSAEHSGHAHDSNRTESPDQADQELLVSATEYSFSPSSIRLYAGQNITITLENAGRTEHDFEIVGTNVHIHAAPGDRNSALVRFEKAGYYQVVCTLPGHQEAGMTASIQVAKP